MKLYDLAEVIRSKNAGPFSLTIDLLFNSKEDFSRVMASSSFNVKTIADLYGRGIGEISILPFEKVLAIKITMKRVCGAGGPDDLDVYGAQQHFPLGNIEM